MTEKQLHEMCYALTKKIHNTVAEFVETVIELEEFTEFDLTQIVGNSIVKHFAMYMFSGDNPDNYEEKLNIAIEHLKAYMELEKNRKSKNNER